MGPRVGTGGGDGCLLADCMPIDASCEDLEVYSQHLIVVVAIVGVVIVVDAGVGVVVGVVIVVDAVVVVVVGLIAGQTLNQGMSSDSFCVVVHRIVLYCTIQH